MSGKKIVDGLKEALAVAKGESDPARVSMLISHTTKDGEIRTLVSTGAKFKWIDGTEWEIVRFEDECIYSPSGLGVTPTLACKQIGGELFAQIFLEPDGTVIFCGDSVAAAIARA